MKNKKHTIITMAIAIILAIYSLYGLLYKTDFYEIKYLYSPSQFPDEMIELNDLGERGGFVCTKEGGKLLVEPFNCNDDECAVRFERKIFAGNMTGHWVLVTISCFVERWHGNGEQDHLGMDRRKFFLRPRASRSVTMVVRDWEKKLYKKSREYIMSCHCGTEKFVKKGINIKIPPGNILNLKHAREP
jgi:hypothetical protein